VLSNFSNHFGDSFSKLVFSGKAYARAVQGHFIVQGVLIDLLLDYLKSLPCDPCHVDLSSPVAMASDVSIQYSVFSS
jgi:hypothetical protein